ncbi:MAG: 30S ribosomal protein S4 [Candidatus Woesearchaeota archaeon]
MGDPRRTKSKYSKPGHPWQKERIEEERALLKEYGLKNKTEIYRARSKLKTFSDLAKKLIAARGSQAEKEKQQLLTRLAKMGLVKQGAKLDDVLGVQLRNILERRLQTIAFRKGLARSINQARQFITHEHVMVNNRIVSSPSYHVPIEEETSIVFVPTSKLANTAHPERALPQKKPEAPQQQKEERKRRAPPHQKEGDK